MDIKVEMTLPELDPTLDCEVRYTGEFRTAKPNEPFSDGTGRVFRCSQGTKEMRFIVEYPA